MADRSRTGVVPAGGYSTRFGETDKALTKVDDTPMIARVADRLSEVVDSLVVSCREDQHSALEDAISTISLDVPRRFAFDLEPDRGPLAGITHSFEQVDSAYAAVVACDMPFIDPAFIEFLFDRTARYDAAVPELKNGYQQPMQAVYNINSTLKIAKQCLNDDNRSFHRMLSALDTVRISPATITDQTAWRSLCNLNSREDLDRLT